MSKENKPKPSPPNKPAPTPPPQRNVPVPFRREQGQPNQTPSPETHKEGGGRPPAKK